MASKNDRIIIIPRGVDFDRFAPEQIPDADIADIRSEWGLSETNRRLVLFLPARLTEWKGQALALDALSKLAADEREALVLVMAGDAQGRTKYLEALQATVIQHQLVQATRITGHCDRMPVAMAASDIVLAPSLRPEAFGRTARRGRRHGPSRDRCRSWRSPRDRD